MKKMLKIIFTILFIIGAVFEIYRLIFHYSDDVLLLIIFASVFFLFHLFAWIAPKAFFNLCWKIAGSNSTGFDYETSFRKLELVDIGIIITADFLLLINIFLIIF